MSSTTDDTGIYRAGRGAWRLLGDQLRRTVMYLHEEVAREHIKQLHREIENSYRMAADLRELLSMIGNMATRAACAAGAAMRPLTRLSRSRPVKSCEEETATSDVA